MPDLPVLPPDVRDAPGLHRVVAALTPAGGRVRVAGGAVRDGLLGHPAKDIDLATDLRPDAVAAQARRAGLSVIETGLQHGTVTVMVDHTPYEVTTLRADVRCDGRHAEVAYVTDFAADAARRDLTINALFADPDGRVHDFVGGVEDLHAGRVRFVGAPDRRIREDYLRILRFFRFRARYGRDDTAQDSPTLAAIAATADGLARISGERIWSELGQILAGPRPSAAVRDLAATGSLAAAGGGALDPERLGAAAARGLAPAHALAWAAGHDAGFSRLADAWRLSRADRKAGQLLLKLAPEILDGPQTRAEDALVRGLHPRIVTDLLVLDDRPETARRVASWTPPVFPLAGRDLIALGLPAGPAVGRLLADLEERWRASRFTRSRDELLEEARTRIAGGTTP